MEVPQSRQHIHEGKEALEICPVCKHPKAYFELVEDHY